MKMNSAQVLKFSAFVMISYLTVFSPAWGANDDAAEIVVEPPQQVERWFAALGSVNKREFEAIIAEDARIVLKDLGVEQTKQEFISALAEWQRLTRGANIIYRYVSIEENTVTVNVCYRFRSNEQLNQESFTFEDEQITGSVQEFKGDDCGDM
jgi:hypothetical protein